jgi:hypothetical protein
MTNKKEALASVLPDIVKYVIEHEDEIPSYMKDAFTQEPSLEDNEVKDFQDGGPVSSAGVIKDEFGNFIPAPRMVGSERPVNPNAKKVFLKPDIPEGRNVESPFEGTPVSSIYAGIEYDDQGKPVVDSSFPMDREQQAALDSQLNVDAMSDDAFIDYFGPGLMNISIIDQVKEQLGLQRFPSIPPTSVPSAFVTTVALIGDKLSKSLARGALNNKYSNPDERMNILQGVVSKFSPVNRQDAEFSTRVVNTPMDTSLQDYERAEQQVGVPSVPASPAPAPSAPSPEQAAADTALNIDVGPTAGIDVGMGAPDVDVSVPDVSAPDVPDSHGGLNKGGPVNMQVGGEVDNADTNMEVANVPMGVVGDMDGAPAPFNGGTGVEDDLNMEVEAGSYILNAEAVQLIGVSDINKVIRDAYTIAARLGKPMPEDYDPQDKVPIRISNGEAVVPRALVDIIGLDKLEKWNQKGLELRKQKEEFMAQQQQAQPPQGPQVAAEAPMQQQMGQLMDKGGEVEASLISRVVSLIFGDDPIGDVKKTVEEQEAFTNIIKQVIDESKFTPQEIEKELEEFEKAEGGTIPSFKDGGFLEDWLIPKLKDVGADLGLRGKAFDLGPIGKINVGLDLYHKESVLEAAELAGSLLGNTAREKRNATNLLKGTAAAESDLGETFRDINRPSGEKEEFTIGPFQVTKLALEDVTSRVGDKFHKGLNANIDKIKQHPRFKHVDFSKIDVDDLKDPYINAIIARLYYSIKTQLPIPTSLKDQAAYWKKYYNTPQDTKGDPQTDYIDKVNQYDIFSKFEPIPPKPRPRPNRN